MVDLVNELEGKVAIVTGSARNIGRTTAEELARAWRDPYLLLETLRAMPGVLSAAIGPAPLSPSLYGDWIRLREYEDLEYPSQYPTEEMITIMMVQISRYAHLTIRQDVANMAMQAITESFHSGTQGIRGYEAIRR